MPGSQLSTLCTELNGGASIGETLLFQFINMARALVEQRRPWMILRKTDTSKTATTANTWQTSVDLSSITDFSRFYGDCPVKLFNTGTEVSYEYRQVPWSERLSYVREAGTFVFDEANKLLYLNGTTPFAGTLYIDYIKDGATLTEDSVATAWPFPSWSHLLLAFYAVAIYKGGVDYDDLNARMAPENRATAAELMRALENWDNEKQLSAQQNTDPYRNRGDGGFRSGAINIHA